MEKDIIEEQVDVESENEEYKKQLQRIGSEYVPSSSECL